MEKKFKFSDKPITAKIVYGVVIAILCITAIVIGIVSAASRSNTPPDDTNQPPASDGSDQTNGDGNGEGDGTQPPSDGGSGNEDEKKPLAFISPVVGTVSTEYDMSVPVYSTTLDLWRVHAGIDISTEEGAAVYASEAGVVTGIYSDPMLGYTVEITHSDELVTRYSNLAKEQTSLIQVGDEVQSGDRIGTVGDTSISELAEEPHLHFEVLLKKSKVNPLDYITEESKKASLGIDTESDD